MSLLKYVISLVFVLCCSCHSATAPVIHPRLTLPKRCMNSCGNPPATTKAPKTKQPVAKDPLAETKVEEGDPAQALPELVAKDPVAEETKVSTKDPSSEDDARAPSSPQEHIAFSIAEFQHGTLVECSDVWGVEPVREKHRSQKVSSDTVLLKGPCSEQFAGRGFYGTCEFPLRGNSAYQSLVEKHPDYTRATNYYLTPLSEWIGGEDFLMRNCLEMGGDWWQPPEQGSLQWPSRGP